MTLHIHRAAILFATFLTACASGSRIEGQSYKWTTFIPVDGQPQPVPAEWLSTAEGKFAHSIQLPDAVPKPVPFDFAKAKMMAALPAKASVSEQYFEHLCSTEAGEFVLKTVEDVQGLYFMRPPNQPTDADLMERYKLEAPG